MTIPTWGGLVCGQGYTSSGRPQLEPPNKLLRIHAMIALCYWRKGETLMSCETHYKISEEDSLKVVFLNISLNFNLLYVTIRVNYLKYIEEKYIQS